MHSQIKQLFCIYGATHGLIAKGGQQLMLMHCQGMAGIYIGDGVYM